MLLRVVQKLAAHFTGVWHAQDLKLKICWSWMEVFVSRNLLLPLLVSVLRAPEETKERYVVRRLLRKPARPPETATLNPKTAFSTFA